MATFDPYIDRLFQIESGWNPNAVTGSNRGLGQFGRQEERQFGISDDNRGDPTAQALAVARERSARRGMLSQRLGRDPTPGEEYLAHQQGVAGGPALLTSDPSVPAWQAIRPFYKSDDIAKTAISGNIPRGSPLYGKDPESITAGDFRNFWIDKFHRGMEGGPGATQLADSMQRNPLPNPFDSIPRPGALDGAQANAAPPISPALGSAPADPSDPSNTGSLDWKGIGTDAAQVAKAFGGGAQTAMKAPTSQPIHFEMPPGLQQARALALAMAMRPMIQSTSQTLGTTT